MMQEIGPAIGLVLVIEGLAYALAPSLVESMLKALQEMSLDARRRFGLAAVAIGVGVIWLVRLFGG